MKSIQIRRKLILFAALTAVISPLGGAAVAQEEPYRQDVITLTAADGHSVPALLTYPVEGMNLNTPAVIHIHGGPGADPLAGSGPWIAEGLAPHGYTTLAPLVRHGSELYTGTFEQIDLDIKATVDFLGSLGFRDIILTGSSYGSICTTRYIVDTQDPRIKANIHFAPTADLNQSVPNRIGDEAFWKVVKEASAIVNTGKGMETVYSHIFTNVAQVWLDIWGPASTAVNTALFPQIKQPILLLRGNMDADSNRGLSRENLALLKSRAKNSSNVQAKLYEGGVNHSFYPVHDQVISDVIKWLEEIGLGPKPRILTEALNIDEGPMGEGLRRGLQYTPASGARKDASAFILLHDWAGDSFTGPPQWLGETLAQAGHTALGIQTFRAHGVLNNNFERSNAEIKVWIDYLSDHGYSSVILIGHGYGCVRITQYAIAAKDPRLHGLVYLGPTPDSAAWLSEGMGAEAYQKVVAEAEQAAKSDANKEGLVQFTAPMPPPAKNQSLKIVMKPDAFLGTWGPKAPALSQQIGHVGIPVVLLGGSKDIYMTEAGFNRLAQNARGAATVWYGGKDGADHEFSGFEYRVTNDLLACLAKQNLKPALAY